RQIKIHGFRVEPGEIESALNRSPEVRESVVVVRVSERAARIVAYVVPRDAAAIDLETLREHVRSSLPSYIVPNDIVRLSAVPLTDNGKIDYDALPEPDQAIEACPDEEPLTTEERTLAAIWRDALRLDRVGVHDNFFALGGDSISAILVIARANQQGVR